MTISDPLSADKLEILVQERTAELEKANQMLRAEIIACKEDEKALLQSEKHYRLLFETMLQGVVYQDADGKIISMNPAAERILGKTKAEFLGSSSVDEEHDTIRENGSPFLGMEHPSMVSLRTGREVKDVVMGVYNPREKCYRWININAVPVIQSGEDKPFQVYIIFEDITERKGAKEELQAQSEELQVQSEELQAQNEELQAQSEELQAQSEELQAQNEELQAQSEELQAQSEELQVQNEELQAQSEELHEAYEALNKSEEHYRMLFTNMTDAFYLVEVIYVKDGKPCDYRFLEVNPAYELNMRVKKEQMLSKSIFEVYPEVNPITIEKYNEIAISGKSAHFEVFSKAVNNKYLDVYAFSPEKGKLAVIFRDITERKKADEELRKAYEHVKIQSEELQAQSEELQAQSEEIQAQSEELQVQSEELHEAYETLAESEQRFRSAFDDSAVAMALVDPDVRFLRVNDAFCRMLGFEESEIEGHAVLDFTHPDDVRPSISAHKSVLDGREPSLRIEKRYIRKDGQVIICDVSSSPVLDAKGCPIYTVTHIQDITERKRAEKALQESEKRYRTLFDKSMDGIILTDPRGIGIILSANPAACRMLGWAEEELVLKGLDVIFDVKIRRFRLY